MIQREWQDVQVLSWDKDSEGNTLVDEYGQQRQGTPTARIVEMVCKIYSQTNVTDPRYVDVDLIGLTKDKDITDENVIVVGDEKFNVKYIIPSSRLYQILMKRI